MAILKRDNINTISTIILILTAIFISTTILSSNTYATSASATVHVPDACTLVSTLNTPHTATLSPGTSTGYGNAGGVDGIGQTTLKVTCNDSLGFAIYAIGYSEDTFGNTNLVSNTKNNGVSTYAIATGTNTSGSTSNWAMQINAVSGSFAPTIENSFDSSNYHNIPTTYTMVAKRTSATMNPSDPSTSNTGSSITTTYAAYISTEQAPDTYTGKVKYTMVHPNNAAAPYAPHEIACTAGKICYQPSANDIIGQMGQQTASNNTSVTLYAPNFKRTGYGFAGWSDAYDYETNPDANFYGPMQTITTPSNVSTNGLSLYAVWIKSEGSLQDSTKVTSLCGTGGTGGSLTQDPNDGTADLTSVTALTDERDNNTYAIAKLADGKCWTIENLRLADKDTSNNNINLSISNTHDPSLPLTNSWSYKNSQTTLTTSNHLSTPVDPTQTAWCYSDSSNCNNQSMLATNNITLFTNNTSSSYNATSNVYSYGNYYNWYSATAGHGKYGSDYGSNFVSSGDICPAGWHLPTSKITSGEFNLLDVALGGTGEEYSNSSTTPTGTTMSALYRSYPNNFVYSGRINSSPVGSRNSTGYYWSASGSNSNYARYFHLYSTTVYPSRTSSKYIGHMVRCVSGI